MAAGTSYYKTAAPDQVIVEGESLSAGEIDLYHHLYDDGLREFAVTNGLAVPRPVAVVPSRGEAGHPLPSGGTLRPGLVVPIGGGKDSMVLIEALRHLGPRLFAVNPHPLVLDLAAEAGLDLLVVRRHLDPGLAGLHRAGALNGHVPVTAIVSLIAAVGAFVHGYDTVAMAVERSASEETVAVGGVPVNHQYSKSRDFEVRLADLVADDGGSRADLRIGPAALVGARHLPGLRPTHPVPRHLLQLQHRLPPGGGGRRPVVRTLSEVPVRRPHAGPVPGARPADRHHRHRPVRRSGPGRWVRGV